jgi:signal transduction histidine kinase
LYLYAAGPLYGMRGWPKRCLAYVPLVWWCVAAGIPAVQAQSQHCDAEQAVVNIERYVHLGSGTLRETLTRLPDAIAMDWRIRAAPVVYVLPMPVCTGFASRGLYIGANVTSYTITAFKAAARDDSQTGEPLVAVQPALAPQNALATRSAAHGLVYSGRAPTVFLLPQDTAQVHIRLQTASNFPFGLGAAQVGPLKDLLLAHGNDERVGLAEQSGLALVMGVVGAMSLLAWCVRRRDAALLFFGLATVLFAARTGLDYTALLYVPAVLFENTMRWTLVLLACALACANLIAIGVWTARLRRTMLGICVLFTTLLAALAIPGVEALYLHTMSYRWMAFAVSSGLTVYVMWRNFQARHSMGYWRMGAVLAAYSFMLLIGQVIALRNMGSIQFHYAGYFIYAYAALVLVVGALVGERALRALQRAENLNAELGQRVAQKNAELSQFYALQRDTELRTERESGRQHERERFTREMHDGIGAQLVTALRGVERGSFDSAQVAQSLQDGLDELRLLMDSADVGRSLQGALVAWRNRWDPRLTAVGLTLLWEVDPQVEGVALAEDVVLQLMRILQEAVTNAIKHSQGDEVLVQVNLDGRKLCLRVTDNGVGFRPTAQNLAQRGLRHIAQRAQQIGAQHSVQPARAPARGTEVQVGLRLAASGPQMSKAD